MLGQGLGIFKHMPILAVAGGYDFGNCLLFDGTNDYVDLGQTYIPFTNRTVSFWWYKTSDSPSHSLYNTSLSRGVTLSNASDPTIIKISGGSSKDFTVPSMANNTWHHIMIQSDASNNTRVFLNGVESSSGQQNTGTTFNIQRIGSSNAGFPFRGRIDDLFFSASGVAGDAADAAAIYNSGAGASPEDVLGVGDYWLKLNESGTTTTAADEYGGTGSTLNNFPTSGQWVAH